MSPIILLLASSLPGWQEVVAGTDAGSAGETSRCVAQCRFEVQAFCRVSVEQVRLQHAVFDHYRAARWDTLAVESDCCRSLPTMVPSSMTVTLAASDLFAQLAQQETTRRDRPESPFTPSKMCSRIELATIGSSDDGNLRGFRFARAQAA